MTKRAKPEITQTTVELKTGVRNSIKVCYPGGDVAKIVHTKNGHTVTTDGARMRGQVSDATIYKILCFVRTYANNSESDLARFRRLAGFFESTSSINEAVSRF